MEHAALKIPMKRLVITALVGVGLAVGLSLVGSDGGSHASSSPVASSSVSGPSGIVVVPESIRWQ